MLNNNENLNEAKFNPTTPNFRTEAGKKIAQLFPEVVADGQIDFDALQEVLSPDLELTGGDEKYGFTWRGKSDAKRIADTPARNTTLVANKEKSKDWDTTQNVYIEGDNLEVLKLLQKAYTNKVKLIYIDPPYNTGKDFVYHDDFHDSYENYLKQTGQVDNKGNSTTTNKETNGRFHTDWLNMMYPRLKLARNLLTEDGVIFVSIDNNEQAHLKEMMDEIFGEENFVNIIVWQRASGGGNASGIITGHDFIFVYQKNINNLIDYRGDKIDSKRFPKEKKKIINGKEYFLDDDVVRKVFGKYSGGEQRRLYFEEIDQYRSLDKAEELRSKVKNGEYILIKQPNGKHFFGQYKSIDSRKKLYSIIQGVLNNKGPIDIAELGLNENYFEYPKPVHLIKKIISSISDTDAIILDFFSGSGTTAQATINSNVEDGGNRKFIMVQLPEKLDKKSGAYKDNYRIIPDIAEERIRRAGEKILSEHQESRGKLDVGFKVYELQSSTINKWNEEPNEFNNQLELFNKNIFTEDSNNQQRAREIAIKSGIPLTINPVIENDTYHYISEDKEVFVVLGKYDENLLRTLDGKRQLSIATVVLHELENGSEIKFNLLEQLKQNTDLNNHFNLEWL
ncbi:MAG: site-specific DNA-methyltransferase [Lactobacillaceae bacterium]|jgi:adenine-specific DNA-methyltransferase|nr:site-specific DNA-methyltransferase [Lactobacillaceae bacterium]